MSNYESFNYNKFRVFTALLQNGPQTARALVEFFDEDDPMHLGEVCDSLVTLVEDRVVRGKRAIRARGERVYGELVYDLGATFRGVE